MNWWSHALSWLNRPRETLRDAYTARPPAPDPVEPPPHHLSNTSPIERFGTCPVCASMLLHVRRINSETRLFSEVPSWRVDIGHSNGERERGWRVRTLADASVEMMAPSTFSAADIAFVYVLCADGHIFPYSAPVRPGPGGIGAAASEFAVNRWRMVAFAGPTASGKTYLVIRTLLQSLVDALGGANLETEQVTDRALSPLEEMPLNARRDWYNAMLNKGDAMPSTNIDFDGTPRGLLEKAFPSVLEAITTLITKHVVNGEAREPGWGLRGRQPLVMRTSFGRRTTWTGVIDMPGEAFEDRHAERDEVQHLGYYDAIVWVVDPVIATAATPWLDLTDKALEGSSRPGSFQIKTEREVRRERNDVQLKVGRGLSVNRAAANPRGQLSTYVAVSKADLIHRALLSRTLTDLGAPGTVLKGGEKFLHRAALMQAEDTIYCDSTAKRVLELVYGVSDSPTTWREETAHQIAKSILDAYSDRDRFWNLVEDGAVEDSIELGADIPLRIEVPTIGQHLAAWNKTTSPANLLIRDLVMSVVGCGLAYGLGYSDAAYRLLLRPSHETRFFVCSALGKVPTATDDTKIEPLDSKDEFPEVMERSAGLTQLMLAMLGGARA